MAADAKGFHHSGIGLNGRLKDTEFMVPSVQADMGMEPTIGTLVNPTPVDARGQCMGQPLADHRPGTHRNLQSVCLEP